MKIPFRIQAQFSCPLYCITVNYRAGGMAAETRNKIFTPYFTTKGEAEGTGLGLVITKKVVEEHQGTLELDSTPGEGTRVTMTLPLFETVFAAE